MWLQFGTLGVLLWGCREGDIPMGVEFKRCSKCGNTVPYFAGSQTVPNSCDRCGNLIKITDADATKKHSKKKAVAQKIKTERQTVTPNNEAHQPFHDLVRVTAVTGIVWTIIASFGSIILSMIFYCFWLALCINDWLPNLLMKSNRSFIISSINWLNLLFPAIPIAIIAGAFRFIF